MDKRLALMTPSFRTARKRCHPTTSEATADPESTMVIITSIVREACVSPLSVAKEKTVRTTARPVRIQASTVRSLARSVEISLLGGISLASKKHRRTGPEDSEPDARG